MSSSSTAAVQNPDHVLPVPKTSQRILSSQQDKSTNRAALSTRQTETVDGKGLPLHPATTTDRPASAEQVEAAVSQISEFIQSIQRDLVFSIDESSDRLVVKIVDSKTHEVIRQIPSEEMLRIASHLDSTGSLILREQA